MVEDLEDLAFAMKLRELVGVLDTRRRLDAAGDVDRVGIERRGLAPRYPASDPPETKTRLKSSALERVEAARLAGAAEKLRMKRVEQNKVGLDFGDADIDRVERRVGAQPQRANHRHRPSL